MSDDRIRLLQQMAIFGGVKEEVLAFLLERASFANVAEGGYFFREDSSGTSAFVLERGRVAILKRHDGSDYLLRRLEAGDCFGEMALLDFGARSASVLAEEDCAAIELTGRDLLEVSRLDIQQFTMIYMNLGRELSRRLRAADERMFRARVEGAELAAEYDFYAA